MKNDVPTRIFSVMLLGIIGALIYFWGSPVSRESQAFVTTPEFVIWFFINEVLFAIYPILLIMVWRYLSQLREQFRHNMLEILGASILLFGLFMLPLRIGNRIINMKPLPLENADAKILVIQTVGFLASALPLALGIWLIQSSIRDTFRNLEPTEHLSELQGVCYCIHNPCTRAPAKKTILNMQSLYTAAGIWEPHSPDQGARRGYCRGVA